MKHSILGAACASVLIAASGAAQAAAISGQGTWETTLLARDLDGNLATAEAYYDTALDITWLADANYGAGSSYDNGPSTTDGRMVWGNAYSWTASLNPYGSGITGWRLPTTVDADGPDADSLGNDGCDATPSSYQGLDCGYNITIHSEMSHMFYVTLGDKAYYNTSGIGPEAGWGLTNTGPFSNVHSYIYWSVTKYAPDIYTYAWFFSFDYGYQGYFLSKAENLYAWAVHDGDVGTAISSVPIPAAAWLFGSGLLGLIGSARRKRIA